MPGGQGRNAWNGSSAEALARHILKRLAFTTQVRHEDDIGHDFHCTLITSAPNANFVAAGPFFAVQVKSNTDSIRYEKAHARHWIMNQENPYLVCIVDLRGETLSLFSTWQLTKASLISTTYNKLPPVVLVPSDERYQYEEVKLTTDGQLRVPLGKPIMRLTASEVADDKIAGHHRATLRKWLALERMNIVNAASGIGWALGPLEYQTNEPPFNRGEGANVLVHYGGMSQSIQNFMRSATALRRNLERAGVPSHAPLAVPALDQVLKAFAFYLEEPSRNALRDIGLDLRVLADGVPDQE